MVDEPSAIGGHTLAVTPSPSCMMAHFCARRRPAGSSSTVMRPVEAVHGGPTPDLQRPASTFRMTHRPCRDQPRRCGEQMWLHVGQPPPRDQPRGCGEQFFPELEPDDLRGLTPHARGHCVGLGLPLGGFVRENGSQLSTTSGVGSSLVPMINFDEFGSHRRLGLSGVGRRASDRGLRGSLALLGDHVDQALGRVVLGVDPRNRFTF